MNNYINKDNSLAESPTTNSKWVQKTEKDRINLVSDKLKTNLLYNNFVVTKAEDDGQVILKIEQSIPANTRGLLLLELEEMLKKSIDNGITIWLEPVGDKSKLRNLRGIEIKPNK